MRRVVDLAEIDMVRVRRRHHVRYGGLLQTRFTISRKYPDERLSAPGIDGGNPLDHTRPIPPRIKRIEQAYEIGDPTKTIDLLPGILGTPSGDGSTASWRRGFIEAFTKGACCPMTRTCPFSPENGRGGSHVHGH